MKNCIILHLHYQIYWTMYWEYLKDIVNDNVDLYITINDAEIEFYNVIKSKATELFVLENKGMDFGPFLYVLNKIKNKDYFTVTKLHEKNKDHTMGFDSSKTWMQKLFLPLIETNQIYETNVNSFKKNSNLFYIANKECNISCPYDDKRMVRNYFSMDKMNNILDLQILDGYSFTAGSIFMASKTYLDLLLKNKELEIYNKMNFVYERDGTLAHVLERYIGSYVKYYGGETLLL